jgi:Ca2+-binding EF-hand superfamily protein
MFKSNQIDVSDRKLRALFAIVDKDKTGKLDIDEFQEFSLSVEANQRMIYNFFTGK